MNLLTDSFTWGCRKYKSQTGWLHSKSRWLCRFSRKAIFPEARVVDLIFGAFGLLLKLISHLLCHGAWHLKRYFQSVNIFFVGGFIPVCIFKVWAVLTSMFSTSSRNLKLTDSSASCGHSWNQSMAVQFTTAGNFLLRTLSLLPTGEKHRATCNRCTRSKAKFNCAWSLIHLRTFSFLQEYN